MKIADILMLLGGLSLFLYGMKMMSEGLEVAAGNKMKKNVILSIFMIIGILIANISLATYTPNVELKITANKRIKCRLQKLCLIVKLLF